MERWADAFELTGVARDEFIGLADLAHCPELIQERHVSVRSRRR
jgi:hypothetical protein